VDPYSEAGHVRGIDLFFAIDMVFFSSISFVQTFMYPAEKSNNQTTLAVVAGCVFFFGCAVF
jgi:hypothetical protein